MNRASIYFWWEWQEMPELEICLHFWQWWCFEEYRVGIRTVAHFSSALIYPKGKDMGTILLFQWVGYRVLLRRSQSHELGSMDGLSQTGWITGLGLLKYVLWYIPSAHLFSWNHLRMLPTLGNFSLVVGGNLSGIQGSDGSFMHSGSVPWSVFIIPVGTNGRA